MSLYSNFETVTAVNLQIQGLLDVTVSLVVYRLVEGMCALTLQGQVVRQFFRNVGRRLPKDIVSSQKVWVPVVVFFTSRTL